MIVESGTIGCELSSRKDDCNTLPEFPKPLFQSEFFEVPLLLVDSFMTIANWTMCNFYKNSAQVFQIGQKIRQLRLDAGLTPRDLADELSQTPSFIARLEQGLVDIDAATINKLSKILGVSVLQIVDQVNPYRTD